jgi:hypothetical protein
MEDSLDEALNKIDKQKIQADLNKFERESTNEENKMPCPSSPVIINEYMGIATNESNIDLFISKSRTVSIELNANEESKDTREINVKEKGKIKD